MADFDFSTLVTDRSPSDLELLQDLLSTPMSDWTAEQLAEFNLARSKGAYNYTDLNRVTACMDYLNERLTGYGYATGYQRIEVPHKTQSRLPEGYTELTYIESTGTQYIDTGIQAISSTTLEFRVKNTGAENENIFCEVYQAPTQITPWYYLNGRLYFARGTSYINPIADSFDVYTVQFLQSEVVVDGTSYQLPGNGNLNINYYLFCQNNSTVARLFGSFALYGMKIYDNGEIVRDFVPCTNPDGVTGLYDIENDEFYQNAGTGTFTAGPEITPEPGEVLDTYTWYESDIPTASTLAAYLSNVAALRGVLTLPEGTPTVPPDMGSLTTSEANAIEQILSIIQDYLVAMQQVFLRSGMPWAISGGPNYHFAN